MAPAELRSLQVVACALIAGPALFLGVALYVRSLGTFASLETLGYVAAAYALGSPMLAGLLRQRLLPRDGVAEPSPEALRRALIASFSVLEGAAFLCGLGLLLGRSHWPLAAAAVPLAAMVAWFPRAEAG